MTSNSPAHGVPGSEPAAATSIQVAYQEPNLPKASQVFAQGRLLPARGTVRISGLPGDRIEEIAFKPGQPIQQGATIAKLQSFGLRTLELEAALLKLAEAKALLEVKQKEAALQLEAAKIKQQSASIQLKQALAQRQQATQGIAQVESLGKQIATLERLRNDPLTRAAIGTIELETRRNEMQRVSSISEQTVLASNHAVELGELQVEQAERSVISALESSMLVDKGSPVASLEKQIEILKEQVRQSQLLSPLDGFVMSVNAEAGERVGQLPIAEVADLREMACMAEVHESDVGKLAVGNRVELRSPAIQRTLAGTITRIDRVVGSVQMRSPNPMARSDFRAVPVWITIDPSDAELASRRIQLQVDIAISSVQ
jgi:HlyD family secretion protein